VYVLRKKREVPPAVVEQFAGLGCLVALAGFVAVLMGLATQRYWLSAAGAGCFALLGIWGWLTRMIGRNYRLEKNVLDAVTVKVHGKDTAGGAEAHT
jgi:hypothetical protein